MTINRLNQGVTNQVLVKAVSGQTTNLLELQDSTGAVVSSIGPTGALGGTIGNSGLVHIKTETFSAVSSVSIGSNAEPLFTSEFENYYFEIQGVGTVTGSNLFARLRDNVTDASGSNYVNNEIFNTASTPQGALVTTTQSKIGFLGNVAFVAKGSIFRPFLASRTFFIFDTFADSTTPTLIQGRLAGEHNLANSFNGITLRTGAGNLTGSISIYGVAQ